MKSKEQIESKIRGLNAERLKYIEQKGKAKFTSIEAELYHNLVVIKTMQMQILEWCLE